eukprot:scaffold434_cov186-Pinguiococcus_pyrenoidosus.AAC.19
MSALDDELEAIAAIFPEVQILRSDGQAHVSYELPDSCGARLRLVTAVGYPDAGVRIDIDGGKGALQRKSARHALVQQLQSLSAERSGVEHLMELIAQAEQHLPAIDAAAAADAPPEAPQLGRRGVWFHHIISKVRFPCKRAV